MRLVCPRYKKILLVFFQIVSAVFATGSAHDHVNVGWVQPDNYLQFSLASRSSGRLGAPSQDGEMSNISTGCVHGIVSVVVAKSADLSALGGWTVASAPLARFAMQLLKLLLICVCLLNGAA